MPESLRYHRQIKERRKIASSHRGFLTQPISWLRLGIIVFLAGGCVWLVSRDPGDNRLANQNSTQVESKTDSAAKKDSSGLAITEKNGVTTIEASGGDEDSGSEPKESAEAKTDKSSEGTSLLNAASLTSIASASEATSEPAKIEEKPAGPTPAQKEVEKLLGKTDYDLKLLLSSGKTALENGKLNEAENYFQRAAETSPEYRDVWYLLGYTKLKYFEEGAPQIGNRDAKADEAVKVLKQASTLDPQAKDVKDLLEIALKAAK